MRADRAVGRLPQRVRQRRLSRVVGRQPGAPLAAEKAGQAVRGSETLPRIQPGPPADRPRGQPESTVDRGKPRAGPAGLVTVAFLQVDDRDLVRGELAGQLDERPACAVMSWPATMY